MANNYDESRPLTGRDARGARLPLTQFVRDQLHVEAQVDRRTLAKALRGQRVSPMPLARILGALRARGLEHLLAARNTR